MAASGVQDQASPLGTADSSDPEPEPRNGFDSVIAHLRETTLRAVHA